MMIEHTCGTGGEPVEVTDEELRSQAAGWWRVTQRNLGRSEDALVRGDSRAAARFAKVAANSLETMRGTLQVLVDRDRLRETDVS